MNIVKQTFSIRDLENLSGIKSHTIRIWEKRYGLLNPQRTDTNIRTYDLANLQKLLNVILLYKNGLKISKIAKIPEGDISMHVKEIVAKKNVKNHAINAIKLAMMDFDQALFQKTYNDLLAERSFREIFWEVFIPFLEDLGLLWQTNTIGPAHEHFITNLIKQKIYTSTEKMQAIEPTKSDKTFVLFLPENEIHEIGLLFINYEIILRGYKTIFLGQTMPIDFLDDLQHKFSNLVYLSYFTVAPSANKIKKYIREFTKKLNLNGTSQFWILGRQTELITPDMKGP
ncbi:MAG: MerR family transcriptional regulator, partial [Flavobacteriaceae bacterium]|nr:MerR family transcriptional regulator [Flavobacteriaceae bacterium]